MTINCDPPVSNCKYLGYRLLYFKGFFQHHLPRTQLVQLHDTSWRHQSILYHQAIESCTNIESFHQHPQISRSKTYIILLCILYLEVGVPYCTEIGNEKVKESKKNEKENKLKEDHMQHTHKLDLLISVICFLNSTISCTLDLNWRLCYYVWLSTKQFDLQLNDVLWESMGIGEIHISMTPNSVTNDRVNILCEMKLDSWAPWLRFNLIYKWQRCLTFDNLVNDPVPSKMYDLHGCAEK